MSPSAVYRGESPGLQGEYLRGVGKLQNAHEAGCCDDQWSFFIKPSPALSSYRRHEPDSDGESNLPSGHVFQNGHAIGAFVAIELLAYLGDKQAMVVQIFHSINCHYDQQRYDV